MSGSTDAAVDHHRHLHGARLLHGGLLHDGADAADRAARAQAHEFDLIWFGVIAIIVIEMGLISPPVGLNVYIVKGIANDVPMSTIFRGIWPFWIAMAVCIGILMVFPNLALFLPNTMFN